jgi:uncharacterized protein YyaL (SSP411 family)
MTTGDSRPIPHRAYIDGGDERAIWSIQSVWYLAPMKLSTRIRFALGIAVCCGAFFARPPAIAAKPIGTPAAEEALPTGALTNSPSAYLREAAHGPVQWQPWDKNSFALARKLKRPTLIDIGAIWCHWCHVMDDTTYANAQVAAILNQRYVPIKVDMDERPDIDAIYQNAAQRLTGAGGWPLTCFATSSGALLYAAGYLRAQPAAGEGPTSAMAPILERIATAYEKNPADVEREASVLAKRISSESAITSTAPASEAALRKEIIGALAASYDRRAGGFDRGSGPRFYNFPAIRLAIAYGFFQHDSYREMAVESLDKISRGGVFDQLGGGFHRYSTDQDWRVPHFEKMAYDQAMAFSAYSEAYEVTHDSRLLTTIAGIRSYVNDTLLDPATHAFYADQDADSFKGDDGSYYTWTLEEVKKALPAEVAKVALPYYGLTDAPARAPDGRIVLWRPLTDQELAAKIGLWPPTVKSLAVQAKRPLLIVREKRQAPAVDRAIMTDRNALMISGYLSASEATGDRISRQAAIAALDFILANLRDPHGGFYHLWASGHASVAGIAADQVDLLGALIDAYQISGEEKYLKEARALADLIAAKYRDRGGMIANRSGDGRAFAEHTSVQAIYDLPLPSVQASAARAMRSLGELAFDGRYTKIADALLAPALATAGSGAGASLGTLGLALEEHADGGATVAIVGNPRDPRTQSLAETALSAYRPGKVVMRIDPSRAKRGAMPESARAMYAAAADRNSPLAFVCAGSACSRPSTTTEQLRRAIGEFQVSEIARSQSIEPAAREASTTTSP